MLTTIVTSKPGIGQDFEPEKQKRRSLLEVATHASVYAGYQSLECFINNEIRLTFNSRLPGKFAGDKTAEINLKRQALQLEYQIQSLHTTLTDKKNQLSKLRRKKQTLGDNDTWDKVAGLELEIRELEAILTKQDFDRFFDAKESPLGLTHDLHESEIIEILDLAKASRRSEKKQYLQGNNPTQLTKLARHKIKQAGSVLKLLYGNNVMMTTFTQPGRTDQGKKAIADHSSIFVHNATQCIRDYERYYGIKVDYLFCWEPHKDGTLHLHFIWASNQLELHGKAIEKKLEKIWFDYLDDLGTTKPAPIRGNKYGDFPGVDVYQRLDQDINNPKRYQYRHISSWKDHKDELKAIGITVNHTKCTKDPAAYVSSYVKKGAGEIPNDANFYYPSRWWGQSSRLENTAKEYHIKQVNALTGDSDTAEILENDFQFLQYLQDNDCINYFNSNSWDIYSNLPGKGKKAIRINRKPWEPRPGNSIRVSNGTQIRIYIKPEKMAEVREYLAAIASVGKAVNTTLPKDFNKFFANKYYADQQEQLIDADTKEIYANRYRKHKAYWDKLTYG
jgi:hypothetical protein